jgi:hypothetical protein
MRRLDGRLGILFKVLVFMAVFLALHFAHYWLPYAWAAWFTGSSESVFEHAKFAYFAYVVACALEVVVRRKSIPDRTRFLYSRLAAVVILPLWMVVLWYIAPAIYGQAMPNELVEILYANLILLVLGLLVGAFERNLERVEFTPAVKVALWGLFGTLLMEAVIFSYRMPWADVFKPPY